MRTDMWKTQPYEMVCSGTTGYAEALHIQYDASVITLRFLLSLYYDVC